MTHDAPFNQLTNAEAERLACLIEECGEVIQAATKVLRHGYESNYDNGEINRYALEREIGDLQCVVRVMLDAHDIDEEAVAYAQLEKLPRLKKYTHHQTWG